MLDMTSCSRGIGSLAVILGLLLALSGAACSGGPTEPSEEERIALYTGKWRGNINAFEVILDVRTDAMDLLWLNGAGTARNTATGEMHRLTIFGAGQWGREWEQGIAFLNIDTAREFGPG